MLGLAGGSGETSYLRLVCDTRSVRDLCSVEIVRVIRQVNTLCFSVRLDYLMMMCATRLGSVAGGSCLMRPRGLISVRVLVD